MDSGDERSAAVFTSPLAILADVGYSQLNRYPPMLFVPLGVTFTAGDIAWSVDVAYVQLLGTTASSAFTDGRTSTAYLGGWVGFGPVFQRGITPLNGLFATPKITLGVFRLSADRTMVDLLIGADVGYQLTVGRFYLAFILGISVGLAMNENDLLAGPWTQLDGVIIPMGVALGLNLHLLRVGYAF